jgi:ABC-type transporter Mla subunit MlaD
MSNAPTFPTYDKSKTKVALDGHLESLKLALQMTPQQKELWRAVQRAIHEINRDAYQRHYELAVMPRPGTLLDTLEKVADDNERRAKDLRKFIDAARPFAASLTDVQRKRLPDFLGVTDNIDDSREPTGQRLIFEQLVDETGQGKN